MDLAAQLFAFALCITGACIFAKICGTICKPNYNKFDEFLEPDDFITSEKVTPPKANPLILKYGFFKVPDVLEYGQNTTDKFHVINVRAVKNVDSKYWHLSNGSSQLLYNYIETLDGKRYLTSLTVDEANTLIKQVVEKD